MNRSLASACPDLIVLWPGAGYLSVFAYQVGLGQQTLLWRERVECTAGADPLAELPPLLARHAMRLETPAALVADPASGGFLLVPGHAAAQRDQAWVGRQLELALPYPAQELCWRSRAQSGQVEIFWLPAAWLKGQADSLSKLGLRLAEIYPRASLWREQARQSVAQQPCLLQEADALHVFDEALVRRSAPLPAEPDAAAQAQQLERLALGTAGAVRKIPHESEEALARRVLALWLDGSDAIHLAVGRWAAWASWQPALTLSAAGAALVVIAAIGLNFHNAALEDTLAGLTREQRKLAPIEQKFKEMQSSIRSDRQYVAAAKALDASALPLDALNRITAALPDKYWIQHLQLKGETLDLAGRGGSNDEVIRLLGNEAIAASAVEPANAPSAADKTGAFSIRLQLNKLPGGEGR